MIENDNNDENILIKLIKKWFLVKVYLFYF